MNATIETNAFTQDIPYSLALQAHSGTSFTPERRAESEQREYSSTLASIYAELQNHVRTPEDAALVESEFARFREGFKRRYVALLSSRSRIVSTMIAGPSNFPVRQMEKRNRVVDARRSELLEFVPRAKAAIIKALHPELRPIMAGDSDATERLAEKIATAEQLQERMKAANATIRKNAKAGADAQITALVDLGFSSAHAGELIKPDFCGRIGFADFELTNNNANIRRMKTRLESVSRSQSTEATVISGDGVRIEDCPADNRVRLFFNGKPSEEIRSGLKSYGFRWSPTIGAWQAYRNDRSMRKAREMAS